jgi:hypothetical protein
MSDITYVKELSQFIVERMTALGLKGKKRDDATLHYWIGAATGAGLAQNENLAQHLRTLAVLLIATRGYEEVERMANTPDHTPGPISQES